MANESQMISVKVHVPKKGGGEKVFDAVITKGGQGALNVRVPVIGTLRFPASYSGKTYSTSKGYTDAYFTVA